MEAGEAAKKRAYVSIRQHASVGIRQNTMQARLQTSIRQHTRQDTVSGYVCIREDTSAYEADEAAQKHTCAYVSIRHHA